MMNKLFNTPFEMGLRVILLLSISPESSFTVDRIVGLDFISCYPVDFNLPFSNLHGDNDYKYGEMVNRRLLVFEAVKDLVIRGLIKVTVDKGYYFSITDNGKRYVKTFESDYAVAYRKIADAVVRKYANYSDDKLLSLIQNCSIKSLKDYDHVLY